MDSETAKCARIACVVEAWRNPEPECVPFRERQREAHFADGRASVPCH